MVRQTGDSLALSLLPSMWGAKEMDDRNDLAKQDEVGITMTDIKTKVMEITNKALQERIEQETLKAKEHAERDAEIVSRAIELIQKNLMYKEVKESYYPHYVPATEEMFFEDFLKKPDYDWLTGIKFNDNKDSSKPVYLHGSFSVNGERYYDIRYLLDKYASDVQAAKRRICNYENQLSDMLREFDRMVEQRPKIKRMLEEWRESQE